MAIRRRRLAKTVVGFSRKPATLRRAKQRGAIDAGTTDLKRAVRNADLVILGTPVDTIVPLGQRAARFMRPGSVLTDVGSVKGSIVRAFDRALPKPVAFVGTHPLAGSEQRGIEAADSALFDGSVCVLTPTRRTNRRALQLVSRMWRSLTHRVVVVDAARHDRLLAAVSHVPHLIAFGLVNATSREALRVAPRSFLDATRVAKSDPELWDDIVLGNRVALLGAMDRFGREWGAMRRLLARADRPALRRRLARANVIRHALEHL